MRVLIAALILLPASSALADTARQFDLVCKGTEHVSSISSGESDRPYEKTWVVDLDAGLWCGFGCSAAATIARQEPAMLKLANEDGDHLQVDRTNGRMTRYMESPGYQATVHAICMTAPFTGLPKRQF